MKWAFLLGSPDISGGSYVIFEHAIRARRRGHDVTIITEDPIQPHSLDWHPEARELEWKTFQAAEDIVYDVAIATWWRTVYELHRIEAVSYAYFVQSIESLFYPEWEDVLRKLVDSTYMLPLNIVTEATWIQKHLKEKYCQDAYLVRNGIRKDIYCQEGASHLSRNPGRLRVLVEGPLNVPFKNVEKTIELCKRSLADEVWLLTSTQVQDYPGIDRVFSRVPIHETPLVYRSCDVIVKLSYVEGMFGPPLEMFHCGGTAITYDVTGHDEYLQHKVNAFIVKRDDEQAVIDFLNQLKQNESLLTDLKQGALATAGKWPDWDRASLQFEKVIAEISELRNCSQEELRKKSQFFFDFYVLAEKYKINYTKLGKPIRAYLARRFPYQYKILRDNVLKVLGKFM